MDKKIELLAPVGSQESLYAAINNGADAVYLGGKLFNARQFASNFGYEKLKTAVEFAHFHGVKVYVTVNILIHNREVEEILDYIKFLYEIDVDAIILQDLGIANLVRKMFPDMQLHASTQMTINNLYGAKFLEEMGFSRVVLARETPIEEIKRIKMNTNIEIEHFIHGALCVSYSGQCLMSSLIGGRSGNRGRCAQPCRMKYSLVNLKKNKIKSLENSHIISTRDLNTLEHLEKIIDSGVTSLKIEGRMKRPEYVATVVKTYRKALDRGKASISKDDKKDIHQIFNREFTKGISLGDFGNNFLSTERPDNRGIPLGKIINMDNKYIYLKLEEDLQKGDGIEYKLSNGSYRGERAKVSGNKGDTIKLEKPKFILKNSTVYKTSSIDLLKRADISYRVVKRPVDMKIKVKKDEFPSLRLNYKDISIDVIGDFKVEEAKKLALDSETLKEQLSKLGNTNYYLKDIEIDLSSNVFLPLGVINNLRREAIEKLDGILLNFNNRKKIDEGDYKTLKEDILNLKPIEKDYKRKISIRIRDKSQFNQLDLNSLDRIYLEFYDDIEDILNTLNKRDIEVYISTMKILYNEDFKRLDKFLNRYKDLIQGVSVSNLGTLKYIKDNFKFKIHTDIGLNILNSYTIDYLHSIGVDSMCLSPELNLKEIKDIHKSIKGNLESIVYGYLPSMILKTCPLALVKGCKDDRDCKDCNLASGYGLKDRMNMIFPLVRDSGHTIVYNSVLLMVLDNLNDIYKSGISMAKIDFTIEKDNIREIQDWFYRYTKGSIKYKEAKNIVDEFKTHTDITKGHFYRGVN